MSYRLPHRSSGRPGKGSVMGKYRAPLTLNLAPMIDCTFLLLIFFAVSTTFKRAEGFFSATLPHDGGRTSVALPISPLIVRVQQYGPNPGDYRLRLDNFLNSPATFDELTEFLAQVHNNPGFSAETPVVIAAEPDVAWDHVVGCWNAAVRAECKNISFGR